MTRLKLITKNYFIQIYIKLDANNCMICDWWTFKLNSAAKCSAYDRKQKLYSNIV